LGVADALRLVEQITEAGGSIAALDLGLDPTTSFGEFGMTIMLLDSLAPEELRTVLRSVFQTVRVSRGRARGRGPVPERVELVFHGEVESGVAPLEDAT
jgi:DNA invertase Pin-like site-specific DNA recombinase